MNTLSVFGVGSVRLREEIAGLVLSCRPLELILRGAGLGDSTAKVRIFGKKLSEKDDCVLWYKGTLRPLLTGYLTISSIHVY